MGRAIQADKIRPMTDQQLWAQFHTLIDQPLKDRIGLCENVARMMDFGMSSAQVGRSLNVCEATVRKLLVEHREKLYCVGLPMHGRRLPPGMLTVTSTRSFVGQNASSIYVAPDGRKATTARRLVNTKSRRRWPKRRG